MFVQSVGISLAAAQPLNFCFLASDLWRVAHPTSAVALLKGYANLISMSNCLRLSEPLRLPLTKKKHPSSRGPSGKVECPPHRLRGASGLQNFSGNWASNLIGTDWANGGSPARRGLALFRFTFGRPKVDPGFGAGEAPTASLRGLGQVPVSRETNSLSLVRERL